MKGEQRKGKISVRNLMVRDMILTRKGGPHIDRRRDDWWDEEDEIDSWEGVDEEEG